MIGTIQGPSAEGARQTVACCSRLDLGSQIKLQIQIKDLQIEDAYLSKVIND